MRKITEQIVRSFLRGENRTIGNSRSENGALFLFNNRIAEYRGSELWITNAGWTSNTTKERLNALPGVRIHQRRGEWYLNDIAWDGGWVHVGSYTGSVAEEVEFDMTSRWMDAGYSRPNYAVFHTHNEAELSQIEFILNEAGIPNRRHETDTAGRWLPNHFIVVLPQDVDNSVALITKNLTYGA